LPWRLIPALPDDIDVPRTLAESLVHGLLPIAPDAMVVVDAMGHIVGMNVQTEQLFGYRQEELLAQPVEVLLPDRVHRVHEQPRAAYAATPRTRPMGIGLELYGRRQDGTEFPVEVSLSPLQTDEGRFVIAAIRDATARQQTEAGLQAALKEKDVRLKETLHRVKNNLQVVSSLLDIQADMVADPRVRARLEESQQRIHAMALIHESLYQAGDVAQIDAADYLRRLSTRLFQVYGAPSDRVSLRCMVEACRLDVSRAIPCGLILHELLSNVLKHAFPDGRAGEIRIELWQQPPGTCVLTIRDDGVGIPAGCNVRQTASVGLQLVGLLATQLGATIALERRGGTAFTLAFPLVGPG
jgi:PAS domain S-box-containing protein